MVAVVKILIPATILLIPAYLIRFDIFGIPTNVLEIMVLVGFGLSVFYNWFKRGSASLDQNGLKRPSLKPIFLPVALILAGLLISTLINENWQVGFGIIKGWFVVPLVFGWILMRERKGKEGEKWLKSVLKWLYWSVFLVSAISLVYYFMGDLTYDGRLKAFYLSPNHLAMYLAPAIFIGAYLARNQKPKISAKGGSASGGKNQEEKFKNYSIFSVYAVSLLIILSSLYLTYSYAAWAAVVLSLIIVAIVKNKRINKRIVLLGLIIFLLIIASQWNSEKFANLKNFTRSSLESRIIIWQSAGKILKDNLIFGIGPGNFQNKYLEYQKYFPPYLEWAVPQPHNLYFAFWLQTGIVGLAGFIILVIKWFKELISLLKKQKNGADIAAVLLGIMLYVLLHGLADTTYWKNDLAMVFWIIFSLGIIVKSMRLNVIPAPEPESRKDKNLFTGFPPEFIPHFDAGRE